MILACAQSFTIVFLSTYALFHAALVIDLLPVQNNLNDLS
jgi:hypothetical protein